MLPGMGGVYNAKNLGLYAYTHQNPIVYSDPDGNIVVLIPILYAAYKAVSVASDVVDIATDIAEGDYTSASVTAAGMLDPTGITNKVRKASMAGNAVESATDNVAKGPKPNDGFAKKHGGEQHNNAIDKRVEQLRQDPSVSNIRKNQQQVDVDGNKVGRNRPDLQYDKGGCHHCVEYDTVPKNSTRHGEVIRQNDPNVRVELNEL